MTGPHDPPDPDDRVEALLRDALSTEAAMVQPAGDGLQNIRERVESGGRAWWRHPATVLAAAAVLGLGAGGAYVAFGGDDDGGTTVADGSPSETATTSPRPSATASPSDSPSSSASPSASPSESPPAPTPTSGAGAGYVYYIHDDGQGPRLYREQPQLSTQGDPAGLALMWMMESDVADPDYATPWDDTTLRDYRVEGTTATVDLSKIPSLARGLERLAVQEIVYTVTANDPSVKRVRFLVEGKPPTGTKTDLSAPVARAPRADVQGLIWLLSPTQGSTVSSPVTITGFGTAFEGTISWEVRKDGNVVAEGATQGGSNGEFGDFSDTVKLDPGDYEISAFESSAENGDPLHIDTKNFSVT